MRTNAPSRWFRMYAEFATDPKVQMLSEADQRRYIMLLCLRCGNGDVTLHDEAVTFMLRISSEEWASTKAVLRARNLISDDNKPTAWEKRQYASDSSAERVSRHREKKRRKSNSDVTLQSRPVEAETEIEVNLDDAIASSVGISDEIADSSASGQADIEKPDPIPPCPQQEILALYAKHLPMLTQPRLWDGNREKLLRDRWRKLSKPNGVTKGYTSQADGVEFFGRFFSYVAKSPTLTDGIPRKEGGAWQPDLPWLLKAENFAKVVDGRYHDEVKP